MQRFKSYTAAPRYHSHAVFAVIRQVTRMNGTTFNGTVKLIGAVGGLGGLGGLGCFAVSVIRQLCTKEDLKEAKDEITRRIEGVEKRIEGVETRIDNHNNSGMHVTKN